MKITSINLPEDVCLNVGLKPIKMHGLDRVVLLTGKNGAGKSRIMNLLTNNITNYSEKNVELSVDPQMFDIDSQISQFEREINEYESNKRNNIPNHVKENHIVNLKSHIIELENQKKELAIKKEQVIRIDGQGNPAIIKFTPQELKLDDSNNYTKIQLKSHTDSLKQSIFRNMKETTFASIQHIQNEYYEATHQYSPVSDENKRRIIENYHQFRENINLFLGTKLERSPDGNGNPTLFNLPLGKTQLSSGQKMLLQFCVVLHFQNQKLQDSIIYIEEPERHLHPSALIFTLEEIIRAIPNGQVWIETHSIHVLAHFLPDHPNSLFYVEDGKIEPAKKNPETAIEGLIGKQHDASYDEELEKLRVFLSYPERHAMINYAYHCLFEPFVASYIPNDPQNNQIIKAIAEVKQTKGKIKVLDFGAGECRLLEAIYTTQDFSNNKISDWLDYYAYNHFSDNDEKKSHYKKRCIDVLSKVYESDKTLRYFDDEQAFLDNCESSSFDIVVMCNVLHEIDPEDWLNIFNSSDAIIPHSLSDNGDLLIVEDQRIAIGEKPYTNGFIVLDESQFKELFRFNPEEEYKVYPLKEGRLKAHYFKKEQIERITEESIRSALVSLIQHAKEQIKELRKIEKPDYDQGLKHAFSTAMFTNSQLVLEELTN